jgi:hypothetical protein
MWKVVYYCTETEENLERSRLRKLVTQWRLEHGTSRIEIYSNTATSVKKFTIREPERS